MTGLTFGVISRFFTYSSRWSLLRFECKASNLVKGTICASLLLLFSPRILHAGHDLSLPEYMNLKESAPKMRLDYAWVEDCNRAKMSSKWISLDFIAYQRYVLFNGVKVYLGYPILYKNKSLQIAKLDYEKNIKPILSPDLSKEVPKLGKIMLDAGHGGNDSGAYSKEYKLEEKTATLEVVLQLKENLEGLGYDVFLTRESDEYVALEKRVDMTNKQKADLFVSIHFNALDATEVKGVEAYGLVPQGQPASDKDKVTPSDSNSFNGNRWDGWNALLGYYVQSRLVKELEAQDRGFKRARFQVLKGLDCPGILVEGGFLTNSDDAELINSSKYRKRLAKAISNGIMLYHKTVNRMSQ
jgi:N-acetylmuramoyl-L-alanine amidase